MSIKLNAEEVIAAAQAATEVNGPQMADPIADLVEKAKRAVSFARGQLAPPRGNPNGRSRAERFEIAPKLQNETDVVTGWVEIFPQIVESRGNLPKGKFEESKAAFNRAFKRLQGILNELAIRRCDANAKSIGRAIKILENPKREKSKPTAKDLAKAKEALNSLKRVVEKQRPERGVTEDGDSISKMLWGLIDGCCNTCGCKLPRDTDHKHCGACHEAYEADQRRRREAEDADLLAQLSKQMMMKKKS